MQLGVTFSITPGHYMYHGKYTRVKQDGKLLSNVSMLRPHVYDFYWPHEDNKKSLITLFHVTWSWTRGWTSIKSSYIKLLLKLKHIIAWLKVAGKTLLGWDRNGSLLRQLPCCKWARVGIFTSEWVQSCVLQSTWIQQYDCQIGERGISYRCPGERKKHNSWLGERKEHYLRTRYRQEHYSFTAAKLESSEIGGKG